MIIIAPAIQMNTISVPTNEHYCDFVDIDIVTLKLF